MDTITSRSNTNYKFVHSQFLEIAAQQTLHLTHILAVVVALAKVIVHQLPAQRQIQRGRRGALQSHRLQCGLQRPQTGQQMRIVWTDVTLTRLVEQFVQPADVDIVRKYMRILIIRPDVLGNCLNNISQTAHNRQRLVLSPTGH